MINKQNNKLRNPRICTCIGCAFIVFAFLLLLVACIHIGYSYAEMKFGIRYWGYSTPASVSLLLIAPYSVVILSSLLAGWAMINVGRPKTKDSCVCCDSYESPETNSTKNDSDANENANEESNEPAKEESSENVGESSNDNE